MTELPDTVTAADVVFVRADSRTDFTQWTAHEPRRPVSIIVEPAGVPDDDVLAVASDIVTRFDEVSATTLAYMRVRLREAEYELTAGDLASLSGDDGLFGDPEAVVWTDASWMLRFADCGLDAASEYGVGVNFVGSAPQGIDLFDDTEDIDA